VKDYPKLWLATGFAIPLMAACGGSNDGSQGTPPPAVSTPAPKLVASDPNQACQKLASDFRLQGTTVDAATYLTAGFTPPGATPRSPSRSAGSS
jgi:hypothetical protein